MMRILILFCFFCSAIGAKSQITLGEETLPEVGDILNYTTFNNFTDTSSYKENGENVSWSFDDIELGLMVSEEYLDIDQTDLADSFPDANMVVNIIAFQSAALRTDSTIEVIGLLTGDFTGFGIEAKADFDDAYLLRKTPLTYGDEFEDSFDLVVQFSSELIPALDTFPLPIPGTTLDSLRITITNSKTETVVGWGSIDLLDETHDVLKIEQLDVVSAKVEAGLGSILGLVWVDVTPLLGDFGFGQESTTYKFVSADSKASLIEFNENLIQDSILVVNGRISSELISSTDDLVQNKNLLNIFPNPTSDVLVLSELNEQDLPLLVEIISLDGHLVKRQLVEHVSQEVSVQTLSDGQYILSLLQEGRRINKVFQIIR